MKISNFHIFFRRTVKPKFSYVVDDAIFFFFFLRMAGMALVMRLLELFQGGTMRKYNFISFNSKMINIKSQSSDL